MENGRILRPFRPHSSILLSGSTGSGKTYWVFKFLTNLKKMFVTQTPKKILYCYGIYQKFYDTMSRKLPNMTLHRGLPDEKTLQRFAGENNVIVLDDLMSEVSKDEQTAKLFTQGTHHMELSVIYIVQNIFYGEKFTRTISLNCQYIVLFRNIRDPSQINTLARQMYPRKSAVLVDAYEEATSSRSFGYLLIDIHPQTADSRCRLQTNIFPDEQRTFYQPKNC